MLKLNPAEFEALQARNKSAWGLAVAQAKGEKPAAIPKAQKPKKYRNHVVVDAEGLRHDSKKEERRWRELGVLLRAGEIRWLARQVRFALPGNTEYRADFVYADKRFRIKVEDAKSEATRKLQAYRIKVRQMKAIHGITVTEV